ncbi:uncharacterized protein (TIGR02145 family) [Dysgonomonas sp. PH5-45]|uniref:hypothetical protein n=1 Tax=unclassified Dysgonomonas TaxID=2630389 RepID=UPI002476862B|nr:MULTISPECIES: hypothetical protein [unclassified Dysgonomonas]MDH6355622.1 uncharacterized protein (TIGR02145 family) [Dysgonomonas sp. PH5-45]MDH6388519.1 uncharacterized protein (TIGR02145 family) [Dysgonomonas sp. PH5-37]
MKLYKPLILAALLIATSNLRGQVTIGADIPTTPAALLDLKVRQTSETLPSPTDDENITGITTDNKKGGGLLLPRVKLISITTLEPFISADDADFKANTDKLKEKLAGLMVYNMTNNGANASLYPGVYVWDGAKWVTTYANEAVATIIEQPTPFTFCEAGDEATEGSKLKFKFEIEGLGNWTYQWYQIVGRNKYVRVGTPIGSSGTVSGTGDKSNEFTITSGVLKGDTDNSNFTGFYKFYCVATSSLGTVLTSDIAEVAVGCGAKNNDGEWISFMCFNLGAQKKGIVDQIGYGIGSFSNDATGEHSHKSGEENVWGSLFQWGRIADGHELRNSATQLASSVIASDIGDGSSICVGWDIPRPWQQIKTPAKQNMFITNNVAPYNWTPIIQNDADQLWRAGNFVSNDPCAHYLTPDAYLGFWDDCGDSGTAWHTPAQDEWASIYRGGTSAGAREEASANTWVWTDGTNGSSGYEIKPDGKTTTLFLPANGYRAADGKLYHQGTNGSYWSTTVINMNAYQLYFDKAHVNPAKGQARAYGAALRCTKN